MTKENYPDYFNFFCVRKTKFLNALCCVFHRYFSLKLKLHIYCTCVFNLICWFRTRNLTVVGYYVPTQWPRSLDFYVAHFLKESLWNPNLNLSASRTPEYEVIESGVSSGVILVSSSVIADWEVIFYRISWLQQQGRNSSDRPKLLFRSRLKKAWQAINESRVICPDFRLSCFVGGRGGISACAFQSLPLAGLWQRI